MVICLLRGANDFHMAQLMPLPPASSFAALSPVYTIQPVVKPVWQLVVSCIQTFNRLSNGGCQTRLTTGLTTGCIVYTAGCQTGCTTWFDNRLNEQLFVQHGCQTGCQTDLTIKPV